MILLWGAFAGELELEYVDPGVRARWGWGELQLQTFGNADIGLNVDPAPGQGDHSADIVVDVFLTGTVFGRGKVLWEALTGPTFDPVGLGSPSRHRLWVSATIAEPLQLKVGAEHSAISWWNRHHHHGAWLTVPISRPYLARFEGEGILPMHQSGLEVFGRIPLGSGTLEYSAAASEIGELEYDEHTAEVEEEAGDDSFDALTDVAWVGAVGWRGGAETEVGFGVAGQHLQQGEEPTETVDQWSGTAHVVVAGARWEVVGETAVLRDVGVVDGIERWSHSGYLQGSWRFGRFTPFVRFDYRDMARDDPFYRQLYVADEGGGADLDAWEGVGGLRWDPTRNLALKLEGAAGLHEERDAAGLVTSSPGGAARLQLAWVF